VGALLALTRTSSPRGAHGGTPVQVNNLYTD
jgi:hypothetical protein